MGLLALFGRVKESGVPARESRFGLERGCFLCWLKPECNFSFKELQYYPKSAPEDDVLRCINHQVYALITTLLRGHRNWTQWGTTRFSLCWLPCVVAPQCICLDPETFAFPMNGTLASGCPGTPPPLRLMGTSCSTSPKVGRCWCRVMCGYSDSIHILAIKTTFVHFRLYRGLHRDICWGCYLLPTA